MVTVMRYLFSLENVEEKRSHYIIAAPTLFFSGRIPSSVGEPNPPNLALKNTKGAD